MSRNSTYSDSRLFSTPLYDRESLQYPITYTNARSKRKPQMSWFLTISLLIVVTGVKQPIQELVNERIDTNIPFLQAVAITVDLLVEAMDEISTKISKEWVGLIILPTISSVAGQI